MSFASFATYVVHRKGRGFVTNAMTVRGEHRSRVPFHPDCEYWGVKRWSTLAGATRWLAGQGDLAHECEILPVFTCVRRYPDINGRY